MVIDSGTRADQTIVVRELRTRLGDRVGTSEATLQQHSHDESHHSPALPWAVVSCVAESDVQAALEICSRHRVPVVPFGVGSGLEGGAIPSAGGISLDLSAMNRVLGVSPSDLDATVEAGVTLSQLNSTLGPDGLFFPVDPGSDPTIGGMVATRASGTNAVRYGTMASNTLGLTVVLANGEVLTTGGRARKSAAGYDLTHLFTGSEGTLGVITKVTLRVYPLPETVAAAICSMADLHQAVTAVIEIIQLGIPVARIELLDDVMVDAVNRYSGLHHPVCPTLMLEFHGGPQGVAEQVQEAARVVRSHGSELTWTESPAERRRLWDARHHALYAAKALRPGAQTWSTDVCVPISLLAECIEETKADIERSGVLAPIVGHVGDGNFHLAFVLEPGCPDQVTAAGALHERLVERALAMGGTCTGEHGIGLGKLRFLEEEHPAGVDVMRRIKLTLDPLGILNPGKVLRAGAR
ncbi:MAG: FAD-binding oxidoreductase [Candidatus Dormibacteria bacterium]